MLKKDKDLQVLYTYYEHCLAKVKDDNFLKLYAEEKIHHSLQVIGAGNYIMKHEADFQNRDARFLRNARLAYLFHDIGRFQEIERMYVNNPPHQRYDHGVFGYEILQLIREYNQPEIILPIKHHGHIIEALYSDPEFDAIDDKNCKSDIEKIIFLTRDADKIANFHLMKNSYYRKGEIFYQLFLEGFSIGAISPNPSSDFLEGQLVALGDIKSAGDKILSYISWLYDLNYQSSFDFCHKTGCFKALLDILNNYNPDKKLQAKIETTINDYIAYRYQQFKG